MTVEFIILVWILRKRFQYINQIILDYVHEILNSVDNRSKVDFNSMMMQNTQTAKYGNTKLASLNLGLMDIKASFTKGINLWDDQKEVLKGDLKQHDEDYYVEKLQLIGSLYEQLCDISAKLNTVFGLLLLYKTVYSIQKLITSLFHLYDFMEDYDTPAATSLESVVSESEWSFIFFFQLVLTVFSCEMCCQEVSNPLPLQLLYTYSNLFLVSRVIAQPICCTK